MTYFELRDRFISLGYSRVWSIRMAREVLVSAKMLAEVRGMFRRDFNVYIRDDPSYPDARIDIHRIQKRKC